jgi:hypothetical protein
VRHEHREELDLSAKSTQEASLEASKGATREQTYDHKHENASLLEHLDERQARAQDRFESDSEALSKNLSSISASLEQVRSEQRDEDSYSEAEAGRRQEQTEDTYEASRPAEQRQDRTEDTYEASRPAEQRQNRMEDTYEASRPAEQRQDRTEDTYEARSEENARDLDNKPASSEQVRSERREKDVKRDVFEVFEANQRQQLTMLLDAERNGAAESRVKVANLDNRQTEQQTVVEQTAHRIADPNLAQAYREEQASVMRQDRDNLSQHFKDQQTILDEFRGRVLGQLERHQQEFEQAFYAVQAGEMSPDRLQNVIDRQRDEAQALEMEIRRALKAQEELEPVSVDVRNAVQEQIERTLDNRQLSDEAIQRVVRIAEPVLNEQANSEKRVDVEQAVVNQVKGQVFEELLAIRVREQVEVENTLREQDQQLEFFEGDHIRDMNGNKLTDGLVVWRDRETNEMYIERAYEAKAGSSAARELNRLIEKLTQRDQQELVNYARDLAREKVLGFTNDTDPVKQNERLATITVQEARDIKEQTARYVEELKRYRVQVDRGGQVAKTRERLDTERLLINHTVVDLAIQGRAQVIKVLPEDVARRTEDALRIQVTEQQLTDAAKAIIDAIKRKAQEQKEQEP